MLAQRCLVGSAATAKVLAYLQTTTTTTDATTVTFSGVNVGTASASRRNIIATKAAGVATASVSSMTVDGDAATELLDVLASGGDTVAAMHIITNISGTSEDVVIVFAGLSSRTAIDTWEATGLVSNTPIDSGTSTATAPTDTLNVVNGGFVVAAAANNSGSATAWTNVTERNDQTIEGAILLSCGDAVTVSGTLAITATFTGGSLPVGVFASF